MKKCSVTNDPITLLIDGIENLWLYDTLINDVKEGNHSSALRKHSIYKCRNRPQL